MESQPGNSHDHDEEGDVLPPHNIIDMVVFGRRLRALRVLNGYDKMSDFTATLRRKYGIEVSDRSLYAIERGEQMPHLDLFFAAISCLNPDHRYFDAAIRTDVADAIAKTWEA